MFILGTALSAASCAVQQPPLHASARKATVLLFVAPECPISNAFAPEFSRIDADYREKGVALFAVHADPRVTDDLARQHAVDYGYKFPFLLDPDQKLAHKAGITVTPEAAVLDARGDVVYVGRINDLYVDLGKRRVSATKHDLRDALDAVLEGRIVEKPAAPAVGCDLPLGS